MLLHRIRAWYQHPAIQPWRRRCSDEGVSVFDRIESIMRRCDSDARVMPPTHVFNEGWLLRVTLDWFADHPCVVHPLAVPKSASWYSEALLSSHFLPRRRGDPLAESYTHAGGVIGQFVIGNSGEGDLRLRADALRFVVIEAKLGSPLSSGTKNAPGYDQAARNVACMAHILSVAGRRPEEIKTLGFFVLAPASRIDQGVFEPHLSKHGIRAKAFERASKYDDPSRQDWLHEWLIPTLERATIEAVSWEGLGQFIASQDVEAGASFQKFYARCLDYNRLLEDRPRA